MVQCFTDDRCEATIGLKPLQGLKRQPIARAIAFTSATIGLKPLQGLKQTLGASWSVAEPATIGLKPLQGLKRDRRSLRRR